MEQKKIKKKGSNRFKTSIVKNPRLRNLRKCLREVLICAANDKLEKLYSLNSLYMDKRIIKGKLPPTQRKRMDYLDQQIEDLRNALQRTPLKCVANTGCLTLNATLRAIYGEAVRPTRLLCKSKKRQLESKKWEEEHREWIEIDEKVRKGIFWSDTDLYWDPKVKKWFCEKCFHLSYPQLKKVK